MRYCKRGFFTVKKLLLAIYARNPAWAVVAFGALLLLCASVVLIWRACTNFVPFLLYMGLILIVVGTVLVFLFWVAEDFKED